MNIIDLTKENFDSVVHQSQMPVLVDFWAPWCGYCRRISPVLDQLSQEYDGRLAVCKVNIDQQPELEERFGVEVIPTLYLFRNGQAGEPIVNPGSKAQIVAWAGL